MIFELKIDFLLFHLTGQFASDNWSSKGLIHATTLKPTQAWTSLGLPNELIPAIGKPWDVTAKTSVGNDFLPAGIPVAIGWSDALAGMLALEVFSKPTAFVISGSVTLNGQALNTRDALGVWDTEQLEITATADSEILLMDIPME